MLAGLVLVPGLVPESPRWLLVRGRGEEAEEVIARIVRDNGTKTSGDSLELAAARGGDRGGNGISRKFS